MYNYSLKFSARLDQLFFQKDYSRISQIYFPDTITPTTTDCYITIAHLHVHVCLCNSLRCSQKRARLPVNGCY